MALHPDFPQSPYETLLPDVRWFPAAEELRSTAYEKLLPPLVANVREGVKAWRDSGYAGASATSRALLIWWFDTDHLIEQADGTQSQFRYYFAQREAVETVIWLYDVRGARDKFDLLRFDASGAVSSNMFDEDWPRFVVKMATGAGKTKVLSLLIAWSYFHKLYEANSELARNFLLIAPNIIVLDRLRADFDGHQGAHGRQETGRGIFRTLPEGSVSDRGRELAQSAVVQHRIYTETPTRADRSEIVPTDGNLE